jgi:autotransporter-associated beta strand protein
MGGGTLTSSSVYVGDKSAGSVGNFTQTGGAVNVSGGLVIGQNGGTGTYALGGGTINSTNLYAGYNGGTGLLTVSGSSAINGAGQFWAGYGSAAVGVINQSSGTVTIIPGITSIGGGFATGSSGTQILSGGTFNASGATLNSSPILVYGQGGNATLLQTGGTLLTSGPFELGDAGSIGVATFTGGTASIDGSGFMTIAGGQGSVAIGALGTGYMNLGIVGQTGAGATVSTGVNSGTSTVYVGFPSGSNTVNTSNGTLSLNCGVLQINSSTGITNYSGTGHLNLNGGIIQAGQANENLIQSAAGLTTTVYPGGAIIDTNGYPAFMTAPLVGATGNGVYAPGATIAVPADPGGTAVIGLPIVTVSTTGSGTGLTAIPVVSGGIVTGVQITNPGQNYNASDSVTFTFTGAGATSTGNTFTTSLAGLVATNTGGGFTKQGAGTLRLAASNTYTGPTKITGGTLQLTFVGSPVTVPNYSFETPQYGNSINYTPTGASWNFSGQSGITDGYGFSFNGTPPDGRQAAFVQNSGYFNENLTFPTTGTYTLSFYTEQRPGSLQTLGVDLDTPYSNPSAGIDLSNGGFVPGPNWTLTSYVFSETAGTHLLTFVGENSTANDYTAYVDDVTLSQYVPATSNYIPGNSPVVISDNATLDLNGDAQAIGSLTGTSLSSVLLGIGTLTTGNDGTSTTFAGVISGTGSVNKVGSGTQTFSGSNTYTGGTYVSGGSLVFASPGALPAFTSLTVGAGATATAAFHNSSSPKNTLFVSSLSLSGGTGAWTSTVDLSNNDMVIRNGSLGTVTNQVAQGYANGTWLGNAGAVTGGIISTAAAANTTHLTALGVIQNDNGAGTGTALYTSFDGQTVVDSDILVKYTYYGDADLSGTVDGSDYSRLDNGALSGGTLTGWFNGDFNYDGVINGSDYTLIDNAYNTQGANISAQIAATSAQIAGTAAVPEPATLSLLVIGVAGLLGRRRQPERM